jgi:acyl-CoA synthetase (AMP-forming)/AMP-acid ligase II
LGGAPVTVSLWKNVREKLFIEAPSIGYGATEASPGITHHPPGQRPTEDGEIGYPFRHLTIHLESDRGIEFSGKSVCLAMIQKNKIEFPRSVLIKDRISIRSDGMFLYQGRLELTLNRGGEKFPLEEIEQKIQKSFGFENLCVAIPHSRLGEDLGILIKIKEIRNPGQQKKMIQDLLKEAYGIHFELSHFSEVNEFPINSASKVDRKTALQILNSN